MYYHLTNDHEPKDIDGGGAAEITIHPWLLFTVGYCSVAVYSSTAHPWLLFTVGYCSAAGYCSVATTVANR
jgi:hypothetical protein